MLSESRLFNMKLQEFLEEINPSFYGFSRALYKEDRSNNDHFIHEKKLFDRELNEMIKALRIAISNCNLKV